MTKDVFQYNGPMDRRLDLEFIEFVANKQKNTELLLILTTYGGAPDAAYKIGRYLQHRYEKITVLIPGMCKSAGTLLAIAADEVAFCPYGEIGPLDIQMSKTDNVGGMESGLNISEAFMSLESRARETFHNIVAEVIGSSGGVISFQTASHSASEIVSSLYGPVFGRIDPEEVGSRARAMRIGEDYGQRLNQKFNNLKPNGLQILSQSYTSHGFVIDMQEASVLFERVREADKTEKAIAMELGVTCRLGDPSYSFRDLSDLYAQVIASGVHDETDDEKRSSNNEPGRKTAKRNGEDSPRASATKRTSTGGNSDDASQKA